MRTGPARGVLGALPTLPAWLFGEEAASEARQQPVRAVLSVSVSLCVQTEENRDGRGQEGGPA